MNLTPSRRSLLLSPAALAAGLFGQTASARTPWYATMRRCGQVNFNERDPERLDIEKWLDYWSSLKLDALLLNAGGIVAFYPTGIPYHHRGQFLGSHDLFGDFTKAAKKRNIRVVARLDCNLAWEDAVKAHPEWFERKQDGSPVAHAESPWRFQTCEFSEYFDEQMVKIIAEINKLYDVDGFFTNGWPSTNKPRPCYCDRCKRIPNRNNPRGLEVHTLRVIDIWKLWDDTAKRKKWDSVYVGNLGGGIRAVTDLRRISQVAGWFNADHQGRTGATPIWDCAQQGRVAQAVMKGRTITNVTGSYANSRPLWRHTSKAPEEATMWMAQTTASGMTPWYHWLGGAPEDLRWQETGRSFFQWIAKYEKHFVNKHSIANVGVVFSQRLNGMYSAPGGGETTEFLQGIYYALLEGRFCFDFVHEDDLAPAALARYKALVLPNVAYFSDRQCRAIEAYVAAGGSVLGTFETARYNTDGSRRELPGLAALFGYTAAADIQGPKGNSYYARIESPHEIWNNFRDTKVLPGAEYRLQVKAPGTPLLSVMQPYPAFPPEEVYTDTPRTGDPAILLREHAGGGRTAYFPGDVERSFWRSNNGDLSILLQNALRWTLRGKAPVAVSGDGIAELFAWRTDFGISIHVLNYTNPNMLRGWFRQNYPIGPQRVQVELPEGAKAAEVRILRADGDIRFTQQGRVVEFEIPKVIDYEVAVIRI